MDRLDRIESVIDEPIHGRRFYTQENIDSLKEKLCEIDCSLGIDMFSQQDKIKAILDYVKTNVGYKKQYFDCFNNRCNAFNNDYLVYRTAYGALVLGQAMCAGYAEALRVLLCYYNTCSYTLLSKLPLVRKKLLHYVVVACTDDDKDSFYILDPESEQYCVRKEMDYEDYKENSIYLLPTKKFTDDVIGTDGAGMLAAEYIEDESIPRVVGTKNIKILVNQLRKSAR